MTDDEKHYLNLITEMLIESSQIALAHQAGIKHHTKIDKSIVTDADLLISTHIQRRLKPLLANGHKLLDEEQPASHKTNLTGLIWVVDPIAGTTCYAAGIPLYAISIGLLENGRPHSGGVCFPELGKILIANSQQAYMLENYQTAALVKTELQPVSDVFNPILPIFQHSSTTIFREHHVAELGLPLVSIPAVNIGLAWTALGKLSASIIKLKLWDFAGIWPVLNRLGLNIRTINSETLVDRANTDFFDSSWKLREACIVAKPATYHVIREKIRALTV